MAIEDKLRDFFQPKVVKHLASSRTSLDEDEYQSRNCRAQNCRERYPRGQHKSWGKFEFLKVFDWYPAHYSKEERKLLFKIDLFVLGYGVINFYNKYLDQTNISNAYVSGMKEELGMKANEYNNLVSLYSIGYCIGEIPALIFMTRNNSWYLLPLAELLWGLCTAWAANVTDVHQLYVIRFLIGLFESPTFPGIHYCLGSWYQPNELHKRAGVFAVSSAAGSMSSGFLQSAAFQNFSGKKGLSGWRWMFIIDSLITIPTAFYGFAFFPGIPKFERPMNPFSFKEMRLARTRMVESGVENPKDLNWSNFKNTLYKWPIWGFSLLWCFANSSSYGAAFSLYLKADGGYSVPQINNYPTIGHAFGAVMALLFSAAVDVYPRERIVPPLYVLIFFSYSCLLVWNIPKRLKFFSFILTSSGSAKSPIYLSWVTDVMRDDSEGRAITLAFMNSLSFFFAAFIPNIAYNMKYAPEFKIGFATSIGINFFIFCVFWIICFIHNREESILKVLEDKDEDSVNSEISVIIIEDSGAKGSISIQ